LPLPGIEGAGRSLVVAGDVLDGVLDDVLEYPQSSNDMAKTIDNTCFFIA
jgi:hypothetical protein